MLQEMSFQHWQQVLHYRDADWPQGLCGSWLAKDVEDSTAGMGGRQLVMFGDHQRGEKLGEDLE